MSSRRSRPRICATSCCGCRCAASSAPTSPSRTRKACWSCPRPMRAPRPSALRTRCGLPTASCARPIPTSKAFIGNLDARAAGWDRAEEALVLGAGGSSRAVVFGLLERGIKRIHLANRTIARAETLARQFGPNVHPIRLGRHQRRAAARKTSRQHDLARHARPAFTRCRRGAPAGRGGRRRPRLCSPGDAAAGGSARRAA